MSGRETDETTIAAGWKSYLRDVVPIGAGEGQRTETRRAFYAGAFHALLLFPEFADRLELIEECTEFVGDVAGGGA